MRLHRPVIKRSWDFTKAAVAWAVERRGRATMSDNQPIAVHWKSGQERTRSHVRTIRITFWRREVGLST